MAEETPTTDQPGKNDTVKPAKGGGIMKKIFLFGVPVFLVQLVVIYFLTARFVVPMTVQNHGGAISAQEKTESAEDGTQGEGEENTEGETGEQYIHVIKDMIINPAGTNGQRYLLTTIALNLSSEEALKEAEKKEIAVRDLLNSVLTSKTMQQLIDVSQRESLRGEIQERAKPLITRGKVKSVYFSKYVVQ